MSFPDGPMEPWPDRCPTCGYQLDDLTVGEAMDHVAACLDKAEIKAESNYEEKGRSY